jgi:hypothetical protein
MSDDAFLSCIAEPPGGFKVRISDKCIFFGADEILAPPELLRHVNTFRGIADPDESQPTLLTGMRISYRLDTVTGKHCCEPATQ